ncbi:MAG: hypothetical protein HUU35_01135 [Armatimonadetes bacterium]|nr:hypothetical protein [Armatimonadota bacterium]
MAQLCVTSPCDGDFLNFHDGRLDGDRLLVTVRGQASPQRTVVVNGVAGNADGGSFAIEVPLSAQENLLQVSCDEQRLELRVYWDRHACRRYRFSTDDNIQFLKDLAGQPYRSLFENDYLAFWRDLWRTYGTRVQHNIYWCEPGGFDLRQMPDRYRAEFADNAEWLHLTFHAEQDEPAMPYLAAGYEQLGRDFDKVTEQIIRFAGESVLSPFTTVHWGEATYEGCLALRDRGIQGLAGYCHVSETPTGERPPGARVSYYLSAAEARHLGARDAWRCHRSGLWFVKHDIVCNTMPPAAVRPHLDAVYSNPHRRELMEAMVHEQYFCPFLRHHQPDVRQRVTECVAWLAEHDYRSVFYEEGFLGSPTALALAE